MAEELGIKAKRLESYEVGRVPIPNIVAQKFCAAFDVNQEWLAEGSGPMSGSIVVLPQIESEMSKCKLFSTAYERLIKPALSTQSNEVPSFIQKIMPKLTKAGLAVQRLRTVPAVGLIRSAQIEKSSLTNVSESVNYLAVKPKFQGLLDRLKKASAQRGKKSALAKFLGVSLVQVSQWLSGDREPGGETTLQMLHWVEQQERQK